MSCTGKRQSNRIGEIAVHPLQEGLEDFRAPQCFTRREYRAGILGALVAHVALRNTLRVRLEPPKEIPTGVLPCHRDAEVRQNYNLGAIFRLCDAFLVERLVVCGVPVLLHKRRLIQAAAGTQRWVPWEEADDAATVVRAAKSAGQWIAAVELTANSVNLPELQPRFPAVLVLGGERSGVSPEVVACADQAVAIPMLGMANSLNVATAAAIVLYELARR